MGSSNISSDKSDTNCIKNYNENCGINEFVQYNSYGNITYYFKYQINLFNRLALVVYDMNEKEIGYIEKVSHCDQAQFNFYDENKQMKFYIERNKYCCDFRYTFYGLDKNVESIITIKFGCSSIAIDEYDKYNSRIKGARGEKCCCGDITYYENDSYGNTTFIIRCTSECGSAKIKIYDSNNMEINFNEKSIFNGGFTKIQQVIFLLTFFDNNNNQKRS